jgi:hypothetical protein
VENQHRSISGYRDLTAEEIDLINRIKSKGAELLELQSELAKNIRDRTTFLIEVVTSHQAVLDGPATLSAEQRAEHTECRDDAQEELNVIYAAEPARWASIAKTDIQTGVMALVRAAGKSTSI